MKLSLVIPILCAFAQPAFAETPWERYVLNPTAENADLVTAIAYSENESAVRPSARYQHILLLETQISAGDRSAFRLAYRLRPKSDGALLEDLTVALSRMIRPHPQVFLEELQKFGPSSESTVAIIRMVGEEYVDLSSARKYEIEKRIEALRSVDEDSVVGTRDLCIRILEDAI